MGNQFTCSRDFFDPQSLLCRRVPCGLDELDAEISHDALGSCDPAGVVFEDTIRHLGELEKTAFHFAGSANLSALRWLFVFGARAEVRDAGGTTLLHVAARTGGMQVVKDLVRRGLDPNVSDNAGWTALHVASSIGRQDVSLYLLQSGVKAQARNVRGQTAQDVCSHPWTKEIVTSYDSNGYAKSPEGYPVRDDNLLGRPVGVCGSDDNVGMTLHFEPFFVPREAIIRDSPPRYEELAKLGAEIFNRSAGHGLAFLVAVGAVRDYPVEMNNFLVRIGSDPRQFGCFLGEDFPIAQTMRLEYLNSLPLLGTGVVSALEVAFKDLAVPSDWVKVDRLTRGLAHFWWRQHEEELQERQEGEFDDEDYDLVVAAGGCDPELAGLQLQRLLLGTETLYRLLFSALMLHQWLTMGNMMTLSEWSQLNTCIEGNGGDVPAQVQSGIYKAIAYGQPAIKLRDSPVPPITPLVPTMEGWAHIHFNAPFHSRRGWSPLWPQASPRLLAEQGGAASVGRSAPLPYRFEEEPPEDSPLRPPSEPAEHKAPDGEATWLSLHHNILLLSTGPGASAVAAERSSAAALNMPPYAFIWLRNAALKEADGDGLRLVLGSRPRVEYKAFGDKVQANPMGSPSPLQDGSVANGGVQEGRLPICLLLHDGRFQPLATPQLELRFASHHDFTSWTAKLKEASPLGDKPWSGLPGGKVSRGAPIIKPKGNRAALEI